MRETKKTIEKIKEIKNWFFEKINKIDKTLDSPTKQIREAVIQILRLSDRDFKNLIVIKFNKIDDNFPENWILLK